MRTAVCIWTQESTRRRLSQMMNQAGLFGGRPPDKASRPSPQRRHPKYGFAGVLLANDAGHVGIDRALLRVRLASGKPNLCRAHVHRMDLEALPGFETLAPAHGDAR